MRKTVTVLSLLSTGLVLLAAAVFLLIQTAAEIDVIGGIGLPTLRFLYLHTAGGACVIMTVLGALSLIAALIAGNPLKPRSPRR